MLSHSTTTPTVAEAAWLARIVIYGCLCCLIAGYRCSSEPIERHHIIEGRKRLGHFFTLPLCQGHHRGIWSRRQVAQMKPEHRVAITDGGKLFTAAFGPQRGLWEILRDHIGLDLQWPVSKILPRRA